MDFYIVTGTTRGLGAALAAQLRGRGNVELLTISRRDADVIEDLASAEGACRAGEALAARLAAARPEKAVLINNAGVVEPVGLLQAVDAELLVRNLQVNLVAPLLLMRAFLGATSGLAVRRIINISSGAGRRPVCGWSAYCAAKAGLDMATRVVAEEALARGEPLDAVSLAPGVIDTPMQALVRNATPEAFPDVERFRAMKADGVLRSAEAVAADILRLEAAGRFSGEALRDLRGMD